MSQDNDSTAATAIHVSLGIVIKGARVLVTRRAKGQIMAGAWEFPGGKMEPHESAADAAKRELHEEVGITIQTRRVAPPHRHTYSHAKVCLYPVYAQHVSGTVRAIEVADFRWVNAVELLALDMLEGNRQLALEVAAVLNS